MKDKHDSLPMTEAMETYNFFSQFSTKQDLRETRQDLRETRDELKSEIRETKYLLKWLIGLFIGGFISSWAGLVIYFLTSHH